MKTTVAQDELLEELYMYVLVGARAHVLLELVSITVAQVIDSAIKLLVSSHLCTPVRT